MPGTLRVRNLEEDLILRLRRRAARHGRSEEAEHREILQRALSDDVDASFDELAAMMRKRLAGRKFTPSEDLVRQGREER